MRRGGWREHVRAELRAREGRWRGLRTLLERREGAGPREGRGLRNAPPLEPPLTFSFAPQTSSSGSGGRRSGRAEAPRGERPCGAGGGARARPRLRRLRALLQAPRGTGRPPGAAAAPGRRGGPPGGAAAERPGRDPPAARQVGLRGPGPGGADSAASGGRVPRLELRPGERRAAHGAGPGARASAGGAGGEAGPGGPLAAGEGAGGHAGQPGHRAGGEVPEESEPFAGEAGPGKRLPQAQPGCRWKGGLPGCRGRGLLIEEGQPVTEEEAAAPGNRLQWEAEWLLWIWPLLGWDGSAGRR